MSTLAVTIRRRAEFAEANGTCWKPRVSKMASNAATIAAILVGFFYRSDIIAALLRLCS